MVATIHKDKNGILWLGGGNGLWRYDNEGWQQQPLEYLPQAPKNINIIYEDKDNTLWMGGPGGFWHYDVSDWQRESHIAGGITGWGFVYEDKEGTLWVAASWAGLWRYGADGWQLQVPLEMVAGGFELEDQYGNLWLGGEDGARRKSGTGKDEV